MFFAIPLAGVVTALVGLVFGIPAARLKGLYLVIATLAAQYILLDFFSRAEWFSGGSVPASAEPFSIFGYALRGDRQYFYVVLAYVSSSYILVTNLMRTRDGRALVAIRDHYLSAEIMGINLTKYRTLSFGLAAFFAGIAGALFAHYQLVVSQEGFGIERSILFLAMIIIGGTGSIMGTLMGTAFVVLLPESMEWISRPEGRRDRQGAVAQQQPHLSARDRDRADHHRVPDVRAGRARASLAADQGLLETLPVLVLSAVISTTNNRRRRPMTTKALLSGSPAWPSLVDPPVPQRLLRWDRQIPRRGPAVERPRQPPQPAERAPQSEQP